MEWTVLGAGSILPRAGFGCSGHALRPTQGGLVTLFDCGPGSVRMLGTVGIALEEVERVCLTHYHPDHCLDLLALAFARRSPSFEPRIRRPLEIIGPRGLVEFLERGAALYGEKTWTRFGAATVVEVDPSERGASLDRGELRLAWVATLHTPHSIAWRADGPGGSVAYSGDTGENADVAELARGADLFVCECSFPDDAAVDHHLTPSSAARLARTAQCKTLLLTHFYPSLTPESAREAAARTFDGAVETARDGSRHRVRA